ncbi:immunoglobulin-like domain-containing protein, partial [Listeria grayi]
MRKIIVSLVFSLLFSVLAPNLVQADTKLKESKASMSKPVILSITPSTKDKYYKVTGYTTPNTKVYFAVYVMYWTQGTEFATSDENGYFSGEAYEYKDTRNICISNSEAINSDLSNSTCSPGGNIPLEVNTPVMKDISNTDTVVTGTGTPYSTVVLTTSSAGQIGKGVVDGNGSFSITIPVQKAGTVVTSQANIGDTKSGTSSKTVIGEESKTPKPIVDKLYDTDTFLMGIATRDSTITVKVNGQVIGTGTVYATNTFKISISTQAVGTKVAVTSKQKDKAESDPAYVIVEKKANEKPVISAADRIIQVGDTFNPLSGVTATDAEDGDLTSKIKVTENTVNTAVAGTYSVTYSVTDSDGNTVTKTISVIVVKPSNHKPMINANDVTLKVGDSFNPLSGVTATDIEDGDLTSKIKVEANTVNTAQAGTYAVTYSVTDSDGNRTVKSIIVVVKNNSQPTIYANDVVLKVGDTFDPLSGVSAMDEEDGDLTSKILVTANTVNTAKAGTYAVIYEVTDSDGNTATKIISVIVKAKSQPIINANDVILKVGDSFNPLSGVTAMDAEDGDLTSKIVVIANTVNTAKPGNYSVVYSVTNSDGNTATKAITVTVKNNSQPIINANDKTIKVGDTFNPLSGVTATDEEDGDLTSKIKVIVNTVNTAVAGTYTVTYSVTDSDGNTATKTITVTVKTNSQPVINAKDVALKVGDTFNPLSGVTAMDLEDGDLTSKIIVTANTVNTMQKGTYSVTYTVMDSDGNITTKTITVTVKNNSQPTINANDKTIKVGDTFNPLSGVTATDAEDGDLTSKVKVTANTVNTAVAGTYTVTYSVTDSDGNTATKTITVTVKNNSQPTINANDKTIKVGDTFNPLSGVT